MVDKSMKSGAPPGPSGLPVVGSVLTEAFGGLDFRERMANKYGDIVRWESPHGPVYQLNHPDDIEHVLVHNNTNYMKGKGIQRMVSPLAGNGLLSSEGETWQYNRHSIQPLFHPDRIEVYAESMIELTEMTLDDWTNGETRLVHEDMMEVTLQIVSQTLFGVDIEQYVDDIATAINTFTSAVTSPLNLIVPGEIPLPSRQKIAHTRETLDEIINNIIAKKLSNPHENDVISMLLAAHDEENSLSIEQIRDEMITLIVAGYETTAVSLTFTIYLLSQHPKVEAKLVNEFDSVLNGTRPTISDIPEMTYTEQVVKESMRLFPPVPTITREAKRPDKVRRYRIPAGARINMNQWTVHRDRRWYDDPLAFKPGRWTEKFGHSLPKLAYFPFAAGPRRCIGNQFAMLEICLILTTIYQDYHLELASDRNLEVVPTVTLSPKEDILMVVHDRSDQMPISMAC